MPLVKRCLIYVLITTYLMQLFNLDDMGIEPVHRFHHLPPVGCREPMHLFLVQRTPIELCGNVPDEYGHKIPPGLTTFQ